MQLSNFIHVLKLLHNKSKILYILRSFNFVCLLECLHLHFKEFIMWTLLKGIIQFESYMHERCTRVGISNHLSWKLKCSLLIVCCPSVCLLTFHNLIIYLRTTGPIITKLGTKRPWVTSFHIACISKHYSFKMYWSTTLYIPMSNTGVFEKIHQDCWLYQFFSYWRMNNWRVKFL